MPEVQATIRVTYSSDEIDQLIKEDFVRQYGDNPGTTLFVMDSREDEDGHGIIILEKAIVEGVPRPYRGQQDGD